MDLPKFDLSKPWTEYDFVAFDTETTGVSPVGTEICEIAAIRYRQGQIVDKFQTLLKPSKPMTDFVIGIHGITNEMVATAPLAAAKIPEFHKFIAGAVPIAHHAPFDLGFVAYEFEKFNLSLPTEPVVCSSLLARAVFPDFPNHRLQTLVEMLQLEKGAVHRALDDANGCLQVALKCFEKIGPAAPLSKIFEVMGSTLWWQRFSIQALMNEPQVKDLVYAIKNEAWIEVLFGKKDRPLDTLSKKKMKPYGLIRNPDGDFIMAFCGDEQRVKRFYLDRLHNLRVID